MIDKITKINKEYHRHRREREVGNEKEGKKKTNGIIDREESVRQIDRGILKEKEKQIERNKKGRKR